MTLGTKAGNRFEREEQGTKEGKSIFLSLQINLIFLHATFPWCHYSDMNLILQILSWGEVMLTTCNHVLAFLTFYCSKPLLFSLIHGA